jgi:hypothetical protein
VDLDSFVSLDAEMSYSTPAPERAYEDEGYESEEDEEETDAESGDSEEEW